MKMRRADPELRLFATGYRLRWGWCRRVNESMDLFARLHLLSRVGHKTSALNRL